MTDNRFPPTPGLAGTVKNVQRAYDAADRRDVSRQAKGHGNQHVRHFYDLSTAHVSPAARQWLEANAWANANGKEEARVAAFATGWMMHVPLIDDEGEERIADRVPSDLVAACLEAKRAGCDYVMFDADADESDTLPVYEEPADPGDDGLTDEEKAALALADEGGLHDELDGAHAIHPEDGRPMDHGDADPYGGDITAYLDGERIANAYHVVKGVPVLAGTGILALLRRANVDEGLVQLIGNRLSDGAAAKFELMRLGRIESALDV